MKFASSEFWAADHRTRGSRPGSQSPPCSIQIAVHRECCRHHPQTEYKISYPAPWATQWDSNSHNRPADIWSYLILSCFNSNQLFLGLGPVYWVSIVPGQKRNEMKKSHDMCVCHLRFYSSVCMLHHPGSTRSMRSSSPVSSLTASFRRLCALPPGSLISQQIGTSSCENAPFWVFCWEAGSRPWLYS